MPSTAVDTRSRTANETRALRLIKRAERLAGLARIASIDSLLERATMLASDVPTALARIASVRVSLERLRGNHDQALLLASEAFAASRDAGDLAGAMSVRVEIGRALLSSGNTAEALKEGLAVLNQIESIVDERRRGEITAEVWRLFAYLYLSLEQFDQSIHFCEKAIESARVVGNVVLEGAVFDCMACSYGTMAYHKTAEAQHDKARELLECSLKYSRQALELARQGGHRNNEATALANIAEGLVQSGHPEEALALMETWAVDAGEDHAAVRSHHLDTHGSICMDLGRYDEAIVLFGQAFNATKQTNLALVACEHLAEAYERHGDARAALEHYKRFHLLFKEAASQAAQRSASTAAIYLQTRDAIARADHHREVAEALQRSNDQLARDAEALIALSRHDALTGLPNRRVMEQILVDHHDCLGIVMIDIDHFKVINDRWSHVVGDAVLKQVGNLIKSCCREMDTPIRYGGDEFAVLLQQTDTVRTAKVAERVREIVHSYDWTSLADGLAVSVSAGFSVGATNAGTSTMALADKRLYDAKQGGRNRVGGYTTLQ